MDAFGSLVADVEMTGNIPRFTGGSRRRQNPRVQVYDYEEEYKKVRLGEIRAQSNRAFSFEGGSTVYKFALEQTITYDEKTCSLDATDPSKRNTKLISARNYITFDEEEQVCTP